MNTIIPFPRPKRIDRIDPEQRKLLPRMLESGNFTILTLEQEQ